MKASLPAAAALMAASLLFLTACAKHTGRTATFGSPQDILSYGVYTAATLDSGYSVKLNLNQNETYSKKKFLGSCFVMEYKGTWTCDNESIQFHLTEFRQRPNCETGEWTSTRVDKSARRLIRSVSPKSFDLLDQEEQSSDSWIKFVKR